MVENIAKIIEALAKLISAFAWPAVGAYLIWRFTPTIKDFLSNLSEGSLKAFGVEASAKRAASEAIAKADLGGGADKTKLKPSEERPSVESAIRLAELVTDAIPRRELQGKRVLWVDDRPDGNRYEMLALAEFGVAITIARSTEDALKLLSEAPFDLIISDMKRGDDEEAGYDFLAKLLPLHINLPVIFYTRSKLDETIARQRGAFGVATKASDLIILITSAVSRRSFDSYWKRRSRPFDQGNLF
ncbi:response regulator [Bradyrhizobium xenonodulans]|uniref:Response regulator n=1 Tax=Bradyrhizobium xenonodulans TaxID=2736875 RepID=A0ABY7MEK9_9BRAD|nr:response regulator [Bradyrhizobium xenonodulans]WBL76029.1 response regulator [Bradyrhizobium xenonodulans]